MFLLHLVHILKTVRDPRAEPSPPPRRWRRRSRPQPGRRDLEVGGDEMRGARNAAADFLTAELEVQGGRPRLSDRRRSRFPSGLVELWFSLSTSIRSVTLLRCRHLSNRSDQFIASVEMLQSLSPAEIHAIARDYFQRSPNQALEWSLACCGFRGHRD